MVRTGDGHVKVITLWPALDYAPRASMRAEAEGAPRLGALSLAALGVNTIVGSGIFRLPSELARTLGPASALAHLAGGVLLMPVALSYAEAASAVPGDGGAYRYARAAFGPRVSFVVGWSMWLASVLTFAVAASAVPGQLAEIAPALGRPGVALVTVVAVVLILGAVNWATARGGARVSDALAIVKVVPLALLVVVGAALVPAEDVARLRPIAPRGWSAFGASLLPVVFALSGFETSAIPGKLAKDPARSVPIAAVGSVAMAAVLYAALQIVAVALVPDLGASERPLADAARALFGPVAAGLVGVLGALALIGLAAAAAFTGPRLLAALADDGWLPAVLSKGSGSGHARASVLATTAASAALVATLDFRGLVDITTVVLALQYLATCVSVPVLRARARGAAPAVRLPFGPTLPVAGALFTLWLATQVNARELAVAGAAVALGAAATVTYKHRSAQRKGLG